MKLTQNFYLDEFVRSDTATRLGIVNEPNTAQLGNLVRVAGEMEEIRALLGGRTITVTSGFRSAALNAAVKGSGNSYHMDGLACDFVCRSFGSPLQVAQAIADSGMLFDQLIHEYGRWVHIGFPRPGEVPRRQVLTIDSQGTRVGLHEARQ